MDSSEILELVKDGVIEPNQVEDFEALDEEVQQLVADGDLDMDEAVDLWIDYPVICTPGRTWTFNLADRGGLLCPLSYEGVCHWEESDLRFARFRGALYH